MKRTTMLSVTAAVCFLATLAPAQLPHRIDWEGWEIVAETATHKMFVRTDSIKTLPRGRVRCWLKMISNALADSSGVSCLISLEEYSCTERTERLISYEKSTWMIS